MDTVPLPLLAQWTTDLTLWGWLALAAFAFEFVARLVVSVRVIMRRVSVPMTLAWLLLLLFVPLVGLVLYALVGETGIGARRARRLEILTRVCEERAMAQWRYHEMDWEGASREVRQLATLNTRVSGMPPIRGNHLELIDDASALLDRLIADIDAAKLHCHLLFYIWAPQSKGIDVGEALIRAAGRGVACRVLVDHVGSSGFLRSDLCERMRAAGVQVVAALPVNALRVLFARIDLRNHRKIAIIDGTVGYCGSQNLTDETFKFNTRSGVGPWIDATARMTGPAVQALQTNFLCDWQLDSDEVLPALDTFLRDPGVAGITGTSIVHVLPSGPGPRPEAIHHALLTLLFGATEEITMTTPYFVPDEPTQAALANAALRGVRVTLILPDVLDSRVVAAASRAYYEELLEAGVRILHHRDGLLHAKTAVVDRKLALVTSANFDRRSFWLNYETSLVVYDQDFAGLVRYMQDRYIAESDEISLAAWRARPWWRRFVEQCAQLFSPLL
jgi:cardiolipin synthase